MFVTSVETLFEKPQNYVTMGFDLMGLAVALIVCLFCLNLAVLEGTQQILMFVKFDTLLIL